MKRKDFDDICEEFSSVYFSLPSTKARRLVRLSLKSSYLQSILNLYFRSYNLLMLKYFRLEMKTQELQHLRQWNMHAAQESFPEEICPSDEKALVLYNPTDTPLLRLPPPPDFSIILNSNLVPGLKGNHRQQTDSCPTFLFIFVEAQAFEQNNFIIGF
ncbi:uncharacterized protein LOC107429932 [Ziziphus jujuba]|uniref:Uncharacterized protein LOC107429932 n=1 Tax=Ziziphus jujuba TaxID=326968 RepID=A0ABM4A939_ZIZJJ|nr:uncharacterized protein LOC107429932 [Ziziphus jujuba]